jgi:hypothetical protein
MTVEVGVYFTNVCSPFFIQLAQKELQKINLYKAPRDKLPCILNCCKAINNLLLNASVMSNDNPPGADEFLPVLIYVTIKVRFTAFILMDSCLVIFYHESSRHEENTYCCLPQLAWD